ncbi:MAG: tetratricopeptide repeat protein [Hydrogenophilales bacterium]|nr:tetratricopeptide repeat protein [Hydrogenophilales bacterium]
MNPFAYDVDQSNFQKLVIETSMTTLVVADFWAEWCGPCKALKPILEKLAEEYAGRFILAKINTEQNQELASQFGVRGIPNVKAIFNGVLVDEFSGALPEAQVREFIERNIPSPADELLIRAGTLRDAGDLDGALETLGEASKIDANNETIRIEAADILLEQGQAEGAQRLLDSLAPLTRMEDRVAQLIAKAGFALGGQTAGDEAGLRATIAADPANLDSRLQLANLLIASRRYAEGMDELLEILQRDRAWNDEAARKTLLSVFNMLGADPLVPQYRRKLASALN